MSKLSQRAKKETRIAAIEQRANTRLADLFYQMHWEENLMHRQIASGIGLPRPTVTRWFNQLGVPSQPSERITKTYLTSWAYKTGRRKPKPRYEGPDRRLQETRGGANVDFFRRWTPEMAYVLGYFAADGCVAVNPLGARYLHFDSIDRDLLKTVKTLLASKQVISVKKKALGAWHTSYRLQIGSRRMFLDLKRLGFGLRKGRRMRLPKVPIAFFPDFVRGYFDGDGSVSYGEYRRNGRCKKVRGLLARFTSESIGFLTALRKTLGKQAGMGNGNNASLKKPFLTRKRAKFRKGLQFCFKGP